MSEPEKRQIALRPFRGVCEVRRVLVAESKLFGTVLLVEFLVLSPVKGQVITWAIKLQDEALYKTKVVEWALACKGIDPKSDEAKAFVVTLKDRMNQATDNPDTNDFVGSVVRVHVPENRKPIGKLMRRMHRILRHHPPVFFFSVYRGEAPS